MSFQPLVVRPSRAGASWSLLVCLALLAASVWVFENTSEWGIMLPIGVVVLVWGAAVSGARLLERHPRIVIEEHGLSVPNLSRGVIPWAAILGVRQQEGALGKKVIIHLSNPDFFLHEYSSRRQRHSGVECDRGTAELYIDVTGTASSAPQIVNVISSRLAARGTT